MARVEGTAGGYRLRLLRESLNKTQLAVELDAELGSGYLQRLEAGKVAHPEHQTLDRVLAALQAGYSERREILKLFGYSAGIPVPDRREVAWALEVSRATLRDVTFPAYLLDCAHRLLAYNRYFPRLLGAGPDSPAVTRLLNVSIFKTLFDPAGRLYGLLEDPDSFLKGVIQALKYEMRLFYGEEWYDRMLAGLVETLPLFRQYWESRHQLPAYPVAARSLGLISLKVAGCGRLRFRLAAERFSEDERFRIIYYLPGDPRTIQQCAVWATEPEHA